MCLLGAAQMDQACYQSSPRATIPPLLHQCRPNVPVYKCTLHVYFLVYLYLVTCKSKVESNKGSRALCNNGVMNNFDNLMTKYFLLTPSRGFTGEPLLLKYNHPSLIQLSSHQPTQSLVVLNH